MGRPRKENPRDKGLRIRMTEEEHERVKTLARRLDIRMSDLFWAGVATVSTDEEKED